MAARWRKENEDQEAKPAAAPRTTGTPRQAPAGRSTQGTAVPFKSRYGGETKVVELGAFKALFPGLIQHTTTA